jgi:hypothetical protein
MPKAIRPVRSRTGSPPPRAHALALALSLGAAAPFAGCAPEEEERREVDQVVLRLSAVPADVACLRLTAAAKARTVVKYVGLGGEPTVAKTLGGLPIGSVTFTAEAFAKGCDAVTTATVPGWISEPETVSIAAGRLANVALQLQRNGRAKVDIGFTDEPLCAPAGDGCAADRDCCGGACHAGSCATNADAGGLARDGG